MKELKIRNRCKNKKNHEIYLEDLTQALGTYLHVSKYLSKYIYFHLLIASALGFWKRRFRLRLLPSLSPAVSVWVLSFLCSSQVVIEVLKRNFHAKFLCKVGNSLQIHCVLEIEDVTDI